MTEFCLVKGIIFENRGHEDDISQAEPEALFKPSKNSPYWFISILKKLLFNNEHFFFDFATMAIGLIGTGCFFYLAEYPTGRQ
jgi:hypothetical protein